MEERGRDAPRAGVGRAQKERCDQSPASHLAPLEAKARVERKASPPDCFLRKPGCGAFSPANLMLDWSAPLPVGPPPHERNIVFQSAPAVLDDRPRTTRRLLPAEEAERWEERMAYQAMQSEAEAYRAGMASRKADDTRLTQSRHARPNSGGQAASRRAPSSARTPSNRGWSRSWNDADAPRPSSSSSLVPPPLSSALTPTSQPEASSRASSRASGPAPARHYGDREACQVRNARKTREKHTPDRRPGDEHAQRRTSNRAEVPQRETPSQQEAHRPEIAAPPFALDRRPGEEYARRRGTARRIEEPQCTWADLALTSPCERLVIWALVLLMILFLFVFIFLCIWD